MPISTLGVWYFCVIRRSGSNWQFFVNMVGSSIYTISVNPTNYAAPITIGVDNYSSGLYRQYFSGVIKDFQIFKKALTQDQIGALMDETFIY